MEEWTKSEGADNTGLSATPRGKAPLSPFQSLSLQGIWVFVSATSSNDFHIILLSYTIAVLIQQHYHVAAEPVVGPASRHCNQTAKQ